MIWMQLNSLYYKYMKKTPFPVLAAAFWYLEDSRMTLGETNHYARGRRSCPARPYPHFAGLLPWPRVDLSVFIYLAIDQPDCFLNIRLKDPFLRLKEFSPGGSPSKKPIA